MNEKTLSSGVQQLIERLRQEGIAEGKTEAGELVEEAHQLAKKIIDEASNNARELVDNARKEAEHYKKAAREAVNLAARDTVLELKSTLTSQFSRRVSEMVTETLSDQEFLKKIILELAGKVRDKMDKAAKVEILLPHDVIGLDELRRHPEKVKEGSLGQFVLSTAGDLFRKGVHFGQGDHRWGIIIRLVDDDLRIELTEEIITQMLLEHLLPRFRALLEGSIQ
jgi:V/A-type H+-transporting ATPase subunit E